ncbi:hypothetical protein bmyco0003_50320 [Bacillus pseudomycoides]|nr:hypothetical protein bmyco0002_50760 [Bacillus pseudomycoides]EEM08261.1 hypothetical protein bmyco0003_50320 [Bacillus pseudomycoides]
MAKTVSCFKIYKVKDMAKVFHVLYVGEKRKEHAKTVDI